MTAEATLLLEEDVLIPSGIYELPRFRRWSRSEQFPDHGRIDYVDGQVEVDLSPEDVHLHGTVKTEIAFVLQLLIGRSQRGVVLVDSTRVVAPEAELSVEPDVVVALHESFSSGRIREVHSTRKAKRTPELEGAPDLLVEVLSDSSEKKDRERLPPLYARAGVPELWLVDVRRDDRIDFEVLRLEPAGYVLQTPNPEGWIFSPLLARQVRLVRTTGPRGLPHYELQHRLAEANGFA